MQMNVPVIMEVVPNYVPILLAHLSAVAGQVILWQIMAEDVMVSLCTSHVIQSCHPQQDHFI